MCDRLNVQPQDLVMLDEIELATNLMIAATEAETTGPMPQQLIDHILGVLAQRDPADTSPTPAAPQRPTPPTAGE